ncbi:MAG TPA: tRNA uridine-5-carboxymethylaminomethyl(34) synthesis GTPase MnmE [Candidatus Krumholzibacteria bacterium]|nr:tRNA uridine-5-carboxymethylaminomethyl(34) synthesis GTPase MnmE [Candidatus Krumholzibacteria bacterium]
MHSTTDTIAALSTAPGEAGIAVIRVSGPEALGVLDRVLRTPADRRFEGDWEHRRLYHGGFFDPAGERVDDVMAAVMRAPDSYTGDDVVEISCHGGSAVVARILETLFASGARPAQPGEFTQRAFLNGKMDLIQAEAVADMIHARTELQRVVAERQLRGALSRRIDALADDMMTLLAVVEANIDFIEEGIDALDVPAALATIARQRPELDDLLSTSSLSRPLREGYRVVIAGPVNAGKSSLFNRLTGEPHAIVTEIPGTTRDVLRETVVIEGVPFILHDTAGLRDGTPDRVEAIGIGRAVDAAESADVVVFVLDASERALAGDVREALARLDASRTLVVWNKVDRGEDVDAGAAPRDIAHVRASAVTGQGVDEIRRELLRLAGSEVLARTARDRAILNARLVTLLADARARLDTLGQAVESREPLELLAVQARDVLSLYEEATGRRYHDGLLDVIFSRFCIGK